MIPLAEIPLGEVILTGQFAVRNSVEIVLEFRREVVFNEVGVVVL